MGRYTVNNVKRRGARIEPWGTPAVTEKGQHKVALLLTRMIRFVRYNTIQYNHVT